MNLYKKLVISKILTRNTEVLNHLNFNPSIVQTPLPIIREVGEDTILGYKQTVSMNVFNNLISDDDNFGSHNSILSPNIPSRGRIISEPRYELIDDTIPEDNNETSRFYA